MKTPETPIWMGSTTKTLGIVRVSSTKQKNNTSPGTQRDGIEAYTDRMGLQLVDVVEFHESAKRSKDRTKFRAALRRFVDEDVRHLCFYAWDRATRNSTDFETMEEMIRDDEMVLHVAHDGFVLSKESDEGEFSRADLNTFLSKLYSRDLRRRGKDSTDKKAAEGWYPHRAPPGYLNLKRLDENGVPLERQGYIGMHEGGRALLHRMWVLRVEEQMSLGAIGKVVVEEGLWAAAGQKSKKLTADRVHKILKNPFYVGRFTWRGKEYHGAHEPMFTTEQWERLQATFGKKAAYGSRIDRPAALAGWLVCEECGCRITAEVHHRGDRRHVYMRCANGRRVHDKLVRLREADVLEQFSSAVEAVNISEEFATLIADALNETTRDVRAQRRREQARFKADLESSQENEDALTDKLLSGVVDDDTYRRQLARIREHRAGLVRKLDETHDALDDKLLVTADRVLELAKQAKTLWEQQDAVGKRALLDKLVLNPRLDGANARYDLKKPYRTLAEMRGNPQWRARVDDFRTSCLMAA